MFDAAFVPKPLRIALIGAGQIANSSHLPAWTKLESARVIWVVDARKEQASTTAARWNIPQFASDYRSLLDREDIDAVDICLPANLHSQVSVDFLRCGKHVLVEKPVATTLADAWAIQRAAEETGCIAMVAENWPFASAARRVLELVRAGELGELFMLSAFHVSGLSLAAQAQPDLASDLRFLGYLFAAGIHTINLTRVLMGDFVSLCAYATPTKPGLAGPVEDDLVLAARFAQGGIGSLHMTGRSRHFRSHDVAERRLGFQVFGTKGVASFDVLSGNVVWTNAKGIQTEVRDPHPSLGYLEEIEHFTDCIHRREEPLTSISDQTVTLATVLAAYRSLENSAPVSPNSLLAGSV